MIKKTGTFYDEYVKDVSIVSLVFLEHLPQTDHIVLVPLDPREGCRERTAGVQVHLGGVPATSECELPACACAFLN